LLGQQGRHGGMAAPDPALPSSMESDVPGRSPERQHVSFSEAVVAQVAVGITVAPSVDAVSSPAAVDRPDELLSTRYNKLLSSPEYGKSRLSLCQEKQAAWCCCAVLPDPALARGPEPTAGGVSFDPALINGPDQSGDTLLHLASSKADYDVTRFLVRSSMPKTILLPTAV
jgi:hypothetical protein